MIEYSYKSLAESGVAPAKSDYGSDDRTGCLLCNQLSILSGTQLPTPESRVCHLKWSREKESNLQPIVYKTIALPIELSRHLWRWDSNPQLFRVNSSVPYAIRRLHNKNPSLNFQIRECLLCVLSFSACNAYFVRYLTPNHLQTLYCMLIRINSYIYIILNFK